jgi:hypothetical protein
MLGALVLIVLIFLPSILALTAWSSQADIVEGLENRHTPGFPGILNISSVDDLLKISSPDVRRALERILECNTLECVEQDELSSRIIQSILYNSTGLNVYDLRNMSYSELLNLINDEGISDLLEAFNTTGYISPADVDKLVATLEDARKSGALSPQAYMAALEILRRVLGESGGSESSRIERLQVDAIRDIVVEASRSGLLSKIIERLSGLYRESQVSSLNSNVQKASFRVEDPRVSFKLPGISSDIALLVLLAIIASLILFNSQKLEATLGNMLSSVTRGGVGGVGGGPLVLRLYWSSVKTVEGVSGVRMLASTTHREYLANVKDRIGGLIVPFENLTVSYELYRYAGLTGREVEEQALKFYNELVGLGGGRTLDISRSREGQ